MYLDCYHERKRDNNDSILPSLNNILAPVVEQQKNSEIPLLTTPASPEQGSRRKSWVLQELSQAAGFNQMMQNCNTMDKTMNDRSLTEPGDSGWKSPSTTMSAPKKDLEAKIQSVLQAKANSFNCLDSPPRILNDQEKFHMMSKQDQI